MIRMTYSEFSTTRNDETQRLIDVREQHEFDEVHVCGAELFPLSKIRQGNVPNNDGRQLVMICRSGARSAMAGQVLESQGFGEVINVEGGTNAAVACGETHVKRR